MGRAVQRKKVTEAATILSEVHARQRVLKTIAWPRAAREKFFAQGARELPQVKYKPYDPTVELEGCARVYKLAPRDPTIGPWLRRQADALRLTATMLGAVGT